MAAPDTSGCRDSWSCCRPARWPSTPLVTQPLPLVTQWLPLDTSGHAAAPDTSGHTVAALLTNLWPAFLAACLMCSFNQLASSWQKHGMYEQGWGSYFPGFLAPPFPFGLPFSAPQDMFPLSQQARCSFVPLTLCPVCWCACVVGMCVLVCVRVCVFWCACVRVGVCVCACLHLPAWLQVQHQPGALAPSSLPGCSGCPSGCGTSTAAWRAGPLPTALLQWLPAWLQLIKQSITACLAAGTSPAWRAQSLNQPFGLLSAFSMGPLNQAACRQGEGWPRRDLW